MISPVSAHGNYCMVKVKQLKLKSGKDHDYGKTTKKKMMIILTFRQLKHMVMVNRADIYCWLERKHKL